MNRGQIPLKSLHDEIYDRSMTPDAKHELKEAYQAFFSSIPDIDARELRGYLAN